MSYMSNSFCFVLIEVIVTTRGFLIHTLLRCHGNSNLRPLVYKLRPFFTKLDLVSAYVSNNTNALLSTKIICMTGFE